MFRNLVPNLNINIANGCSDLPLSSLSRNPSKKKHTHRCNRLSKMYSDSSSCYRQSVFYGRYHGFTSQLQQLIVQIQSSNTLFVLCCVWFQDIGLVYPLTSSSFFDAVAFKFRIKRLIFRISKSTREVLRTMLGTTKFILCSRKHICGEISGNIANSIFRFIFPKHTRSQM